MILNFPLYLSLDDVLLLPQHSNINSRSEVDLSWFLGNQKINLPIISANMDCITGVDMAVKLASLGGLSILPRFDKPEIQVQNVKKVKEQKSIVGASVGINDEEWFRIDLLVNIGVDHLNVDVADGHLQRTIDFVHQIRSKYPHISLSAGVVASADGATSLFKAGADIVKVGIGGGSICTTRIVTGCGAPNLTAILDCAKVARKYGKIIWADGGIKNSGDAVKCLAAGVSAVVLGNVLAGTDETPPQIITINGKKYKSYNGSTSSTEKQRQLEKDSVGKSDLYVKHIEGVEGFVPYKGPVSGLLDIFVAGIKSGYSYCGAPSTQKLWQKAKFIQVTSASLQESNSHDIIFL